MFTIIALVCTLGQAPQECLPETAIDSYSVGTVANELQCGLFSQRNDGEASPRQDANTWKKYMCLREGY